jgi:hypothetical protein
MINKSIAIFSLFLLLAPVACAEGNITFSVPQKDYYFAIGEQAYIPLSITNSYNYNINGILEYTITHKTNSGPFRLSRSNTGSANFPINKGTSTVNLEFGSNDQSETLNLSLNFNYSDNGSKVVSLDGIAIHFVENESDKQNQANPMQSSSQEAPNNQQTTDPFAQQDQQTQQKMQQMMNEQMQKQVQQQQQTQQQSQQQSQQQITTNETSQKYLKQPQNDGFKEVNSTYSRENNTTSLPLQYENSKNGTTHINVRLVNNSVENVEFGRAQAERNLSIYLIGILVALVLGYLVYKNYSGKKEQKTLVGENIPPLLEANFDFREEAGKCVEKAISLYKVKQFKDAYGTAAQALRLYLSYNYGLKKEVTNSELINYLKSKGVESEKFDRYLQLSSLVEFAKHMPDDDEFEDMIKTIKNAMKDENN